MRIGKSRAFLVGLLLLAATIALLWTGPVSTPFPSDTPPEEKPPGEETPSILPESVASASPGTAENTATLMPLTVTVDASGMDLVFHSPGLRVEGPEDAQQIQMMGASTMVPIPGQLDLPAFVHSWTGADGENWVIQDIQLGAFTSLYARVPPVARPAIPKDPDFFPEGIPEEILPESAIYSHDGFWPLGPVELQQVASGDTTLHRVVVHPVQINPTTGEARHWQGMRIRLEPMVPQSAAVAPLADPLSYIPTNSAGYSEFQFSGEDYFPTNHGSASHYARRQAGAEIGACVQIRVTARGMHRISRDALVAAGVSAGDVVGSQIRMFNGDCEIPILTSTEGVFGASDSVLFFGAPFKSYHTTENVYWLGFAPGGLRMAQVASPPQVGQPEKNSYVRQITVRDRNLYNATFPSLYGTRASDGIYDGWFVGVLREVGQPTLDLLFQGASDAVVGSTVQWESLVWPTTEFAPNNGMRLLNSSNTALATWVVPKNTRSVLKTTFPASHLAAAGATTMKMQSVVQPGASPALDRSALSYARIVYHRNLKAESGSLTFGMEPGSQNISVSGFATSGGLRVFNVSDPLAPFEVTGGIETLSGSSRSIRFHSNVATVTGWHVTQELAFIPVQASAISLVRPKGLSDVLHQADFILITPRDFASEARRLLEYRDVNGLRVSVATPEDIYAEFGYGLRDPRAIRQFLGYAYHHWKQPRPRYVVLAGDATFDPLHNRIPDINWIPVPMTSTHALYTAVDSWYAAVNGEDTLPDMAIGRVPVNTLGQFSQYINKVFSQEAVNRTTSMSGTWRSRIHFVAGNNKYAGNNFSADMNTLISQVMVPAGYSVTSGIVTSSSSSDPGNIAIANAIKNHIHSGLFMLGFMGHGSLDKWTDAGVFNTFAALGLTNSIYPVVGVFTCQNGIFHEPRTSAGDSPVFCIAEALTRETTRGASAVIAPTGEAQHLASNILATWFCEAALRNRYITGYSGGSFTYVVNNTNRRLGDAYLNGLRGVFLAVGSGTREIELYEIFGDPALQLR